MSAECNECGADLHYDADLNFICPFCEWQKCSREISRLTAKVKHCEESHDASDLFLTIEEQRYEIEQLTAERDELITKAINNSPYMVFPTYCPTCEAEQSGGGDYYRAYKCGWSVSWRVYGNLKDALLVVKQCPRISQLEAERDDARGLYLAWVGKAKEFAERMMKLEDNRCKPCPDCGGRGKIIPVNVVNGKEGPPLMDCLACQGSGMESCPDCGGSGYGKEYDALHSETPCPTCQGSGVKP